MRVDRSVRAALVGLAVAALLTGCTGPVPTTKPSASATPRDFTVATTGAITTADPAVATTDTDSTLITSVYQRLMLVLPDSGELKPDAATDCQFTSKLVYECTLPTNLRFHNGDVLDSTDVKFSIQRALRLDATGTSIWLLSSLKRIDTPNATTVQFLLSKEDNQFGYALASQAASIVDAKTFDPDTALPLTTIPIGSGPYKVESIDAKGATVTAFSNYVGAKKGLLARMRLSVLADSVAAEDAIAKGSVDVVWRALDSAALQRLSDEMAANTNHTTAAGFTRVSLPGRRVIRFYWNPSSHARGNATLRAGVALALQGDRTLDSIVPVGLTEHVKSFATGGRAKLPALKGNRINLSLRYDASSPGQADLARLLRDRIEELDGVSVRVVSSGAADLVLTDSPAWVNNATGWLQLYLESPLDSSKAKLQELDTRSRTTSGDARTVALTELQKQAASDNTVVPVGQSDGILFTGSGVKVIGEAFGSGQELGLWGLTRG